MRVASQGQSPARILFRTMVCFLVEFRFMLVSYLLTLIVTMKITLLTLAFLQPLSVYSSAAIQHGPVMILWGQMEPIKCCIVDELQRCVIANFFMSIIVVY